MKNLNFPRLLSPQVQRFSCESECCQCNFDCGISVLYISIRKINTKVEQLMSLLNFFFIKNEREREIPLRTNNVLEYNSMVRDHTV